MARIRSIKPEFWVSEQIAECSPNARLTFIGMWNFCDDQGVHPAKPKTLKAELFPMDDITAAQVGEWVDELMGTGLVREFVAPADGKRYWHVTGWARHQKIDRPSCKHPAPPNQDSTSAHRTDSTNAQRTDSTNPHRAPPPGVEGSGEDRSGVEVDSPTARPTADRGTRLAPDWSLPAEWREWAVRDRADLDVDQAAARFADYWRGKPGKDGRKSDWLATWRNWVRSERRQPGQTHRQAVLHADDTFGAES